MSTAMTVLEVLLYRRVAEIGLVGRQEDSVAVDGDSDNGRIDRLFAESKKIYHSNDIMAVVTDCLDPLRPNGFVRESNAV